jgi:hypothetical protein
VSLTGVGECPAEPWSQSQGIPRVGRRDERTPPEIDQYVTIGVVPLAIIVSKTPALTLGAHGHFDNDKSGDMNDPKLLPRCDRIIPSMWMDWENGLYRCQQCTGHGHTPDKQPTAFGPTIVLSGDDDL